MQDSLSFRLQEEQAPDAQGLGSQHEAAARSRGEESGPAPRSDAARFTGARSSTGERRREEGTATYAARKVRPPPLMGHTHECILGLCEVFLSLLKLG